MCLCIRRPAISEQRLSVSKLGQIRYELKTPDRNGYHYVEMLDRFDKRIHDTEQVVVFKACASQLMNEPIADLQGEPLDY